MVDSPANHVFHPIQNSCHRPFEKLADQYKWNKPNKLDNSKKWINLIRRNANKTNRSRC